MRVPFKNRASSTWLRLVSHLGMPLYRNGYALVLSSAATSAIGAVYWMVAAHLYPASEIGSNSAMISAMMFLAGVAGLNMMSALTRFLPVAGRSAHRLVVAAYLTSQVAAVIACLAFLVKIQAWAPEISPVGSLPAFRLWFILGTMAWCIYLLQDSVLVGFGLAPWVPVENTLFALVKMALMIFLAGVLPSFGVFASWTLALPFVLLPTNLYLARRFWKGRSRGVHASPGAQLNERSMRVNPQRGAHFILEVTRRWTLRAFG